MMYEEKRFWFYNGTKAEMNIFNYEAIFIKYI